MLSIIRQPDMSDDKIFEEYEGEKTITFKISGNVCFYSEYKYNVAF